LGNWQDDNGMSEIDIERNIEKYYGRIDWLGKNCFTIR